MWYQHLRGEYQGEMKEVLYCKGKGKKCLYTYIKTREKQPELCINCCIYYGILHKFPVIKGKY